MRTDLSRFTQELMNHIFDSLQDAHDDREWRKETIGDAQHAWGCLSRRLADDDVPAELKALAGC